MTHVLVTGGAGYVGSLLCPQLLGLGYQVTAYDICYFGHGFLPHGHPRFSLIEGDIRDTAKLRRAFAGVDVVINLACISNDASFELDEALSTTVNLDAFEPMVVAAKVRENYTALEGVRELANRFGQGRYLAGALTRLDERSRQIAGTGGGAPMPVAEIQRYVPSLWRRRYSTCTVDPVPARKSS